MNILIPVVGLSASGGNRVLSNLATEWIKRGHRVRFLSHEGGGKPYFPTEADVIWFDANAGIVDEPNFRAEPLGLFEVLVVMRRAVRAVEADYDTILLNHSLTVWPVIGAGARGKCFYYIQLYEPEAFAAHASARMKVIVALMWATYYAIPRAKCFVNSPLYLNYKNVRTSAPVVPPGIDLELYWKKPFTGFSGAITVGIIGRREAWKGVIQSVDAVKELLRRGHDVRLKVAYGHHLPESRLAGLEGRIEIVVPENDRELADFYRSVDLMFALATIQHGAPHYPVIESMACGTPVVTTGYFPGDQETTFIVRADDPVTVADSVEGILREEPANIACRLDVAREKVLPLSWPNVSSIMMEHMTNAMLE